MGEASGVEMQKGKFGCIAIEMLFSLSITGRQRHHFAGTRGKSTHHRTNAVSCFDEIVSRTTVCILCVRDLIRRRLMTRPYLNCVMSLP